MKTALKVLIYAIVVIIATYIIIACVGNTTHTSKINKERIEEKKKIEKAMIN